MLMSIEQYIRMRKQRDGLNEFDMGQRIRNMGLCINYVVDYFEKYFDLEMVGCKKADRSDEATRLRKELYRYDPAVLEWLINVYEEYGKRLDFFMMNFLRKKQLFLLSHRDEDFIKYASEFSASNFRKIPFVTNQTEMLEKLIKNLFRIKSISIGEFKGITCLSNEIKEWLENTKDIYKVNLMQFAYDYLWNFCKKDPYQCMPVYEVEGDSEKNYFEVRDNLFNIDELYAEAKDKPFIQGHKQELEMILVNVWFFDIYSLWFSDRHMAESFWIEYVNNRAME